MYTVHFKFEQEEDVAVTIMNAEPGQSILELALNNRIELRHQCGGVCSCTTCHLYVDEGMQFIDELNKREEDFIVRALNPRSNSRLGCQSLLLEGNGEIKVTLPDQKQFNGQ